MTLLTKKHLSRRTVLRGVDLLICAIYSDAKHADQNPATVRNVANSRPRHFNKVRALRLPRQNRDGIHLSDCAGMSSHDAYPMTTGGEFIPGIALSLK